MIAHDIQLHVCSGEPNPGPHAVSGVIESHPSDRYKSCVPESTEDAVFLKLFR